VSSSVQVTPEVPRTPRAAAIAGIVFALLFVAVVVVFRLAAPATPNAAGRWLTNSSQRSAAHAAFNLVPFCGVAFLWFMGVVRSQIGDAEDKFFSTIYLGSGFLFVAMLFLMAAFVGGLLSEAARRHGSVPLDVWQFARPTTYSLLTNFSIRMAGVFTISTSSIGLRVGLIAQRWFARIGLLIGLFLVLTASSIPWIELLFPAWVLFLSIDLLIRTFAGQHQNGSAGFSVSTETPPPRRA
jgi:hypothetical protein